MGKYSSDSDSSDSGRGRRSKKSYRSKGRSRSPSSESSHRRHKRRCKGRRSRSKERYSKSRRYGNKSSRRSSSSGSSTDDSRRNTSKSRRSPVSSSSTTNSSSALLQAMPDVQPSSAEQLKAKVQRAIEAARSADNLLRQRRGEAPETNFSTIMPLPQSGLLDEINSETFVQRAFISSASAPKASLPDIPLPVVIDLAEEPKQNGVDSGVMSPVLLEDQEGKQQRWVKKLFAIRQKALLGEPMVT